MDGNIIVTVMGQDHVGIVAEVSKKLAKFNINIKDINQTIFEGDIFAMIMLADMSKTNLSLQEIKHKLQKLEEDLEAKIYIQHENLFKKMHRI